MFLKNKNIPLLHPCSLCFSTGRSRLPELPTNAIIQCKNHLLSIYLPLLILFPLPFPFPCFFNVFSSSATSSLLLSTCSAHSSLIHFIRFVAIMVRATTLIDGSLRPCLYALARTLSPRRKRGSDSESLRSQPTAASCWRLIWLLLRIQLAYL